MCLVVKFKGKPDAGNPHVRFDEGEGGVSLPTLPPLSERSERAVEKTNHHRGTEGRQGNET